MVKIETRFYFSLESTTFYKYFYKVWTRVCVNIWNNIFTSSSLLALITSSIRPCSVSAGRTLRQQARLLRHRRFKTASGSCRTKDPSGVRVPSKWKISVWPTLSAVSCPVSSHREPCLRSSRCLRITMARIRLPRGCRKSEFGRLHRNVTNLGSCSRATGHSRMLSTSTRM